eukprot:NODE_40_length_35084_cov_0.543519.p13 type:complete len:268 gc:universal NODE_40_length_35084_cov_0.543519:13854-13051(-)
MLFVLLLSIYSTAIKLKKRGMLDPFKNFYNKNVIDGSIKALQPAINSTIHKMSIELKKDHIAMAPVWLRDSLEDVFGVEQKHSLNIIKSMWQKFAIKIIDLFKENIRLEVDTVLTRFEFNLEENMYETARESLYWRKLKKRDVHEWYKAQIEKIIQRVLPLLYDAAHKTTLQTKDDYGNRIGDVARKVLNSFLPNDLQIPDLRTLSKKKEIQGINNFIVDKLVSVLRMLQDRVKRFTGKAFQDFEELLKTQIESEVRRKVKEKVPFY